MTFGLLFASALAGAAYTLAPGPAFLALLGIGAGSGRWAGTLFLAGHFVGDVVWATLALTAIVGAKTIGPGIFNWLGIGCGTYLCILGARAVMTRRTGDGTVHPVTPHPLRSGFAFGLSNPKAYPVAIAMFTALLAERAAVLDWTSLPPLLASACAGFLTADAILVAVIGAAPVRRWYRRHVLLITRASGVLFIGFGVQAIASARGQ